MKEFIPQVSKEHYSSDYDNVFRFISYYYQIDLAKKLKPKNILEVGIGNKTVTNYLKQGGYNVTTCDFDKNLLPDFVGDIRNLPFRDNSFELIFACEVLEHLPWNDFDKAIKELHRVSSKHVIISIPYPSTIFEIVISFPLLYRLFKKTHLNLFFRIPYFYRTFQPNKEHYWEIGWKKYSINKVRKKLRNKFIIIKEVRPLLNSYRHFFLLRKISAPN